MTLARVLARAVCVGTITCNLLPGLVLAEESSKETALRELPTIIVAEHRVANEEAAGSVTSLVTALRYDAQVDLQSRGTPEGQADITLRGGVFENTAVKIGAVTVFDPQTGHYTALLPIDPRAVSTPEVLTGIDNALAGFNATVATLNYRWQPLRSQRQVSLGVGSDALRSQALRLGHHFSTDNGNEGGVELSYAKSEGDGTRTGGDHDLERWFVRAQHSTARTQTDLAVAYQDGFYGWPGAYTGFSSLAETDHTRSSLLLVNHRIEGDTASDEGDLGFLSIGAYYRVVEDDYDFDRTTMESGMPGAFDHETRSAAIGLQGSTPFGAWAWRYGLQLTADELVRSTDLTDGRFDSRQYATLSVVPSRRWLLASDRSFEWRLGVTVDASDRDANAVLPLMGISLQHGDGTTTDRLALDYSASSQLPGYTALNSVPSGLFGGNANLGRERAETLSLGFERRRPHWRASVVIFARRDDDLVDWTFLSGAPFARQANAVDTDVIGVEVLLQRAWRFAEINTGYSYLDKDAEYGLALVDASFYALNYARHRLTTALVIRRKEPLRIRWDSEFRRQVRNPLRASSDNAYTTSLAIEWRPRSLPGLQLLLVADNLTNSDFEEFPGTPAPRRQLGLKARFNW